MTTSIQELKQQRKKYIDGIRSNKGFEDGIKRLLTDLYPDNAHFIYELLQNAEDAEAWSVKFILNTDSLEFRHDGKRLFSLKDVDSITSIGVSTKRDDPTSIGKFGVGFKAVFAYTNTPEIHSGEFHFRIKDLVVPETDGVEDLDLGDGTTRFLFPFNNPKKQIFRAKEEIERGLLGLRDNTLLFLNNIRFIEYVLPDGSSGNISRFDDEDGCIQIFNVHPHDITQSHWLHFQKDVEVVDDDDKPKICRIAIAYNLAGEENKKSGETAWKIAPLEGGQVSIYFPAEKETSNLRFHLHAPFASTVARDSLRDCRANEILRDHIAGLIVESLFKIRDQGKLTIGFLAVLPNASDTLPAFYEPIRKSIVSAFKTEALTPTRGVSHAPADMLYRGPARIAEVISDNDLSLLTAHEPPLWAANSPQQNQREDKFLDSLGIDAWGWTELAEKINFLESDEDREIIESWIKDKDDASLMRFYALLGEACDAHDECIYNTDELEIIRVTTEEGDQHVVAHEAFFQSDIEIDASSDISFVKPAVYAIGRSETQKKYAKAFLENIGVRYFDAKVSVELRLARYNNPPTQVDSLYYKDLKLFISYWKQNHGYWKPYAEELRLLKSKTILLGVSAKNKLHWFRVDQLCLDAPYLVTGLAELTHIHGKSPVWGGYKDKLTVGQLKDFLGFLKFLGVMTELRIEPSVIWYNIHASQLSHDKSNGVRETDKSVNDDFNIQNIESYLKQQTIPCASLIWKALIKSEASVAKARYRPNSNYPIREADSQLVYYLKKHAWIPNKQGDFCRPQDMTSEDLRTDFPYDNCNGLLSAIGFGENARKRSEEYQARNKKARDIGFESVEDAEEIARILKESNLSPQELKSLLSKQQPPEQPESSVPNPERRRNGVLERGVNAPTKESVTRERTIQPGIANAVAEAKAYLRPNYTNANLQLVCQCCQKEMPFKVGDAYYFEAVQCIRDLNKHYIENRLALCPTCAAMYQHARQTDDAEIRRSLVEHNAPENSLSVEIPITLAGNEYSLRFVGKHWFDLKTILDSKDKK